MNTKPLVVVESPTKVKTLKKYLGKAFNVAATVGHIKDLPKKEMGVDIENDFNPHYRVIPGKQKVVSNLKKTASDASDVYLAPDPDREGEAIAWHVAELLKRKGRNFHRVLFHELTRQSVRAAIHSPEGLNKHKYEAQQARRILDRLVGYEISPLLWQKVKRGLSAGRVQSVALRIICERERAIQAFEPVEYWSITAHLQGETPPPFSAKLVKKNGKKIGIATGKAADAILADLKKTRFVIDSIARKTIKRNPLPPFTTSKLQQESIRKLHFSAKKTMLLAQQLYEGIELDAGEPVGLITYMRTDSTRIADEAAQEALQYIKTAFGPEYRLKRPRFFKNRKKVQDAHEAIRPTSVFNTPERIKAFLSGDQLRLYRLIWNRFVASQMQQALIDQVAFNIHAGAYQFKASGATIRFPGFMAVYRSEEAGSETDSDKQKGDLPPLEPKSGLELERLEPKQHFTNPPPRFSEASLVKELEENGIGRPSTYAAILATIRDKGYVDFIKGSFSPSELGFLVNDLLVASFADIFNVDFTAKMEDDLDRIETAELVYPEVLQRFYEQFRQKLETAKHKMPSLKRVGFPTGIRCPECDQELFIKFGKNGHFLACSGYPQCRYSSDYTRNAKGRIRPMDIQEDMPSDKRCDQCGKAMVIKQGPYGKFYACTGYPDCQHTVSAVQAEDTGVACPQSGCDGRLLKKQSKRGKTFYGCSRFPDCRFAIWDKPVQEPCPDCQAAFLVEKSTKKKGTFYACLTDGCGFKRPIEKKA